MSAHVPKEPLCTSPPQAPMLDTAGLTLLNIAKDLTKKIKSYMYTASVADPDPVVMTSFTFKETVSRDFRPLGFFIKQSHLGP
jgi:hypothetical protein